MADPSVVNETFIQLLVVVVFVLIYSTFIYYFAGSKRKAIEQRKKRFYKALVEGLKNNSIESIDDVINVYKGISGLSSENLTYRYHLSKYLRQFMYEIISKNKLLIESELDDETIIKWKVKISKFIEKNEEFSPYADIPAAERNVLSDISVFIEKKDTESIKRKIGELAGMIQARQDDMNKIRNINNWTIPLSVIGLVLTVIFGILAITT